MSILRPQPRAHSSVSDRGVQEAVLHSAPRILTIRDRGNSGRKVTSAMDRVALGCTRLRNCGEMIGGVYIAVIQVRLVHFEIGLIQCEDILILTGD